MRLLYICIILIATNQVWGQNQSVSDVRLSYFAKDKPILSVLKDLSQKSGVAIVFAPEKMPRKRRISIQAKEEKLGDILSVVLSKTNLKYDVVGNSIVILRLTRRTNKMFNISGYVRDNSNGEPLINAMVYDPETNEAVSTNEHGFYSINLPYGYYDLLYSYLGYGEDTLSIIADENKSYDVELETNLKLNEVVILDEPASRSYNSPEDYHAISYDQMTSMASMGGEVDVVRFAHMLPGVNTAADGFGGFSVRGGSEDENLILFDGVPVYNVDHAFGLLSVFNSDVISNAELHTGSFNAQYGGRLSSVLDIKTRNGNNKKIGGSASLSTLAAKAALEGPIGNNGSSFLVSGRRTFIDPWINLAVDFQNQSFDRTGQMGYYFYDINAKTNLVINTKNQLQINVYRGADRFSNNFETEPDQNTGLQEFNDIQWDWQNTLASITWKRQIGKRMFSDLLIYYTGYDLQAWDHSKLYLDSEVNSKFFDANLFVSSIVDRGGRVNFSYQPNNRHFVEWGGEAVLHRFTPLLDATSSFVEDLAVDEILQPQDLEERAAAPRIFSSEFSGYLNDVIQLGDGFEFMAGMRLNAVLVNGKSYLNWEPRVSILARGEAANVKFGISKMTQNLHRLESTGLGFPGNVWLPSTDRIAPQQSWLLNSTLQVNLSNSLHFVTSVYYKRLIDVTAFKEGALVPINRTGNWDNLIPVGNGDTYGAELSLNKIAGKTTWIMNYTYSVSDRIFPDINNGLPFRYRTDRRHQVKAAATYRLGESSEFGINYHYASGVRVTEPRAFFEDLETGQLIFIYNEKNNTQYPAYNRVDVSFSFFGKIKSANQRFSIGFYNLFNQRNFLYSDIIRDEDNPNQFELYRYSILPIFPSISYSIKW